MVTRRSRHALIVVTATTLFVVLLLATTLVTMAAAQDNATANASFATTDDDANDRCTGLPRRTLLASCAMCSPGAACIVYDRDPQAPQLTGCDFPTGSDDAVCHRPDGAASTCEIQCFGRMRDTTAFEFLVPFKATLPPSTARVTPLPPGLIVPSTENVPFQSNVFLDTIGALDVASTVTKISVYGGRGTLATKGRVADLTVDSAAFAAAPQLTSIALVNMDLSAGLSSALTSVPTGIQTLDLRNTQLNKLPDSAFARFEELTKLSLSTNQLTSISLALPKLNALDLRDNKLTSFNAKAPQLHTLDLTGNNLAAIPPSVFTFSNLRVLNLENNPIAGPLELTPLQAAFLLALEEFKIDVKASAETSPTVPSTAGSDNTDARITIGGVSVVLIPPSTSSSAAGAGGMASAGSNTTGSSSGSIMGSFEGVSAVGDVFSPSNVTTPTTAPDFPNRNSTTSDNVSSTKTSGDGASTLLVVLIVIGAIVLVVAMAFVLLWRKRRNAAKYNAALYFGRDSYTKMASEVNDSGSGASRSVYTGDLPPWADGELLSYRLRAEDIKDARVVGTGGAAVVWLVSYRGGAHQLASKRLIDNGRLTTDRMVTLVTEIKLAASLSHPSVVQFFGVAWTNETDLQALFEYMPNGDLRTFLSKTEPSPSDWMPDKLRLALDVVEALVYTHSFDPPLVHRDLKSRNVLLSEDLKAKLSDFGCARSASENDTMTTDGVGTGRWLAPEILSGSTSYDASSDIYSLGVLLTELDTHVVPYADLVGADGNGGGSEAAILQRVAQGDLQPSLSASCPLAVRKIVRACLSFHASHRPTAIQVAYSLRQALHPTST